MRPLVDVGVVTWNTRDLTVECLRRLLDSDQGADLRLWVHDNASDDGTADAVRDSFPAADVSASAENLGFGAGMNRLMARSDAPWFLALNSDAWPEPGAVGRLVAAAQDRPAAGAVAPLLLRPDGTQEHSTYPFPSIRVAVLLASGLHRLIGAERKAGLMLEGYWQHDRPRAVDWAVGAALLFRRAAIEQLGGFDETFFMYVEDVEWCWRAHQAGWEIWFEPAAVVRHVGNASGERMFGSTRTREYLRNTSVFYRREHGRVRERVYRGVNVVGCARWYATMRLLRRPTEAAWWAEQLRANLGR